MGPKDKLRELPGIMRALMALTGVLALWAGWRWMIGGQELYEIRLFLSLRFQLWLAVTMVLAVARAAAKRIIAAIDDGRP